MCSFGCLYCFSNYLSRAVERKRMGGFKPVLRAISTKQISDILDRRRVAGENLTNTLIDEVSKHGIVQWGALGEGFDRFEERYGVSLELMDIFNRNDIKVRISTKSTLLAQDRYLEKLKRGKYTVSFSIITSDDEMAKKMELGVPTSSERFSAMRKLAEEGIRVHLRYRPIFMPLMERRVGSGGEEDWKVMIDKAVDAGAKAISYEMVFLTKGPTYQQRRRDAMMDKVMGVPFTSWWRSESIPAQECQRANRLLKYDGMMKIRDYAHERGLIVGISDPHFKEYSDSSSCCGFLNDDPVWGNFWKKSLLNAVVEGRKAFERGEPYYVSYDDTVEEWTKKVEVGYMFSIPRRHKYYEGWTLYEHLRNKWNTPKYARSPYNYFEGILFPDYLDDEKNIVYRYRHWTPEGFKEARG